MSDKPLSSTKPPPPSAASAKQLLDQYKFVPTNKKPKPLSVVPQQPSNFHLFVKAGLPLILFSVGASLVLKSALEGKNTERDKSKGFSTKSERQARLDSERDEMVEKLNKRLKQDFDNTKRIERPEEILERRQKEREDRNRWHNRTWRWITRQT